MYTIITSAGEIDIESICNINKELYLQMEGQDRLKIINNIEPRHFTIAVNKAIEEEKCIEILKRNAPHISKTVISYYGYCEALAKYLFI